MREREREREERERGDLNIKKTMCSVKVKSKHFGKTQSTYDEIKKK